MLFDRLPDYSGVPNPFAEAYKIIAGIEYLMNDWTFTGSFQRLIRLDASQVVGTLDELQLVLESILNEGWENRDEKWNDWDKYIILKRRQSAGDWKREGSGHRIPVGSVMDEWAESHGLQRSVDPRFGKSWIVPSPSRFEN